MRRIDEMLIQTTPVVTCCVLPCMPNLGAGDLFIYANADHRVWCTCGMEHNEALDFQQWREIAHIAAALPDFNWLTLGKASCYKGFRRCFLLQVGSAPRAAVFIPGTVNRLLI